MIKKKSAILIITSKNLHLNDISDIYLLVIQQQNDEYIHADETSFTY